MNLRINDFQCNYPSIGGVSHIYFARRFGDISYWLYEQTAPLQYGMITTSVGDFEPTWYNLAHRVKEASMEFSTETQPSKRVLTKLSATVQLMDIPQRDAIERYFMTYKPMVVFRDYNNNYWLIGESFGCRISISGATGTKNGDNAYKIEINSVERWIPRQIDCDNLKIARLTSGFAIDPNLTLDQYPFPRLEDIPFINLTNIPL